MNEVKPRVMFAIVIDCIRRLREAGASEEQIVNMLTAAAAGLSRDKKNRN